MNHLETVLVSTGPCRWGFLHGDLENENTGRESLRPRSRPFGREKYQQVFPSRWGQWWIKIDQNYMASRREFYGFVSHVWPSPIVPLWFTGAWSTLQARGPARIWWLTCYLFGFRLRPSSACWGLQLRMFLPFLSSDPHLLVGCEGEWPSIDQPVEKGQLWWQRIFGP